mmetsp:Transcript_48066/g.35271  ORF Transcript_48066/g.35271 Transcript_48066/m.35271 type:complete len:120 (+) Transcript_48066:268-627(+)
MLLDESTSEFIGNSFIYPCSWKAATPNTWFFNASPAHNQGRSFLLKVGSQPGKDISVLFELVLYSKHQEDLRQISCGWGCLPLSSLDKAGKIKVQLGGGTPHQQIGIDEKAVFYQKKGF